MPNALEGPTGNCYLFSGVCKNFATATSTCESYTDTHLVHVETLLEQEWLHNTARGIHRFLTCKIYTFHKFKCRGTGNTQNGFFENSVKYEYILR